MTDKKTLEWIEKAEKIYGDKYDYSKVNYVNSRIKITIICKKHGEFVVKPLEHLRKECYKCSHDIPTTKEWIDKAKKYIMINLIIQKLIT